MVYSLSVKCCNTKTAKFLLKRLRKAKIISNKEFKELRSDLCKFNRYIVYDIRNNNIKFVNQTSYNTVNINSIDFINLILSFQHVLQSRYK